MYIGTDDASKELISTFFGQLREIQGSLHFVSTQKGLVDFTQCIEKGCYVRATVDAVKWYLLMVYNNVTANRP